MNSTFNVTYEVLRRENGFTESFEIRNRNSNIFNKSILGSYYLVQQIEAMPDVVGEKNCNSRCLNFNCKGDLLCVGYDDKKISIFDWTHNKLKFSFLSQHSEDASDVKFINTNENSLNIISTSNDGQIRHACISPTGQVISTPLYRFNQYTRARPKLANVPRSSNEFVGITTDGRLFQMDLRCNDGKLSTNARLSSAIGSFLPLYDISHHPLNAEICIGGCDAFLRVFDKRNFKNCIQKICPIGRENSKEILHCTYNYNGNEILMNYAADGTYLVNSRNNKPGDYISSYGISGGGDSHVHCNRFDDVCLFGPKSEFVVGTEKDGILFFNKNSEKFLKRSTMNIDIYKDLITYLPAFNFCIHPHPFLPVIASTTCMEGVVIWAPTGKRKPPQESSF